MNLIAGPAVTRTVHALLLLLTLCMTSLAHAELLKFGTSTSHSKFLQADQAFQLESEASASGAILHFHITPGYYLYRERFHFDPKDAGLKLAPPSFAREGDWKDDPNFGRVQVYHEDIDVTLKGTGSGDLKVVWQGCAEAGLCYPPQTQTISVQGTSAPATEAPDSQAATPAKPEATTPTAPLATKSEPATAPLPAFMHTESKTGLLLALFALGLGLSLTPCMWPMFPILAGIIARQHTQSAWRGFSLALAYVLGFASTYALAGLLFGVFGAKANLPMWFQQPPVLVLFALLFAALSLSMFGLYTLQLPSGLQNRFDAMGRRAHQGGSLIGTYILGFFSALVVSPCVSAPLIGVLGYISTTGNAAFGALALFVLGMAMGIPLLILGTTEGRFLPKSGEWMERIKILMGLLMLGVAIALLSRILPGYATLLLWAALATVSAVWLGALEPVQPGPGHLFKGLGVLLLIYAIVLVVGAASGNDDPLQPLARFGQSAQISPAAGFKSVKSLSDVDAAVAQAAQEHKVVMLDFFATWCTNCKTLEHETFTDPAVAKTLGTFTLLRADVSLNDEQDKALMKRFGIYGPPALLFFRDGKEVAAARIDGEMKPEPFLAHLKAHVTQGE